MASGICYTQSGGTKKYDGIVVLDVARGDKNYNPGYIKHDTLSVPGEDHYSFDDPSPYILVEKGSSTRDDCPLIIVTYYPDAPDNPCYFNYKKENPNNPYTTYYVKFTIIFNKLNCKCDAITNIPGTNNGNVTLAVDIQLCYGKNPPHVDSYSFSWLMKDGIDESKYCKSPYYYYLESRFTSQSTWECDNGDGTKTYYRFQIDHSSIPDSLYGN